MFLEWNDVQQEIITQLYRLVFSHKNEGCGFGK